MNEEYNSGIKPWQWIVSIAVIVILLALGGYMYSVRNQVDETDEVDEIGAGQNLEGVNRIVISDQFPGNIVYLTTVQLANDGFVTIHKGIAGEPAAVIGSEFFKKGNQPGSVDLSEKTVDGATYYAVLRMDDGDGKFDATKDLEVKDATGAVIMQSFKATTDLPEDKG